MSLRVRLLVAISIALLISATLGAGLTIWSAARTTHAELSASLRNARASAAAALATLPSGAEAQAGLRRVVHAFDGSRHMRVVLLSPDGSELESSDPMQAHAPPAWFLSLVAPKPAAAELRITGVAGAAALRLQADPNSEAGERWSEIRDSLLSFGAFFVVAALLCTLTVTQSLGPLTALAQGLARAGRGDARPDMPERGPPEIATLSRAFNAMAEALNIAEARNRLLTDQLGTIAEEERAEIARDLHDEIGPLLFAITTFAAAIGRQVEAGDLAGVPDQVRAVQEATARLQREVRDMLGRLHDGAPAPADLPPAIEDLLVFWRSVRPECRFSFHAEGVLEPLPEAARECLFRAAQEGVSNAVRHGRPDHVTVRLYGAARETMLQVADDGIGGPENAGLGLPGMRARAEALGGQVTIDRASGWVVTIRLPVHAVVTA